MGVVFIAIALVSGFIFTNFHLPARYRQKRSTGWESYFHVASWGCFFSIIAGAICLIADYYNIVSTILNEYHQTIVELDNAFTLSVLDFKLASVEIVTLFLSLFFGLSSKFIFMYFKQLKMKTIAKIADKDRLEALLLEATIRQFPIALNLKSKKVYVGLCLAEPTVDSGVKFIEILPLLSGYRDSDTLELKLISNYYEHYSKNGILDSSHETLCLDDFRTVVSKSELDSVSLFDIDTYKAFQSEEVPESNTTESNKTSPLFSSFFSS